MPLKAIRASLGLCLALGVCAGAVSAQAAETRAEVGVLRCRVLNATGFIVGSTRDLACRFLPSRGGRVIRYSGRIERFGIDIGLAKTTELVWGVLATTRSVQESTLVGNYGGISGEATLGVGVGANALLGGFGRSVVLNPISLQAQTGFNIAAGVAGLTLRARR